MRPFIAVDLGESVRSSIEKIINGLESMDFDVRWVDPGNIHMTLKFLGEVREEQISGIEERMSKVLSGVKGFKANISGVGYFGGPGHVKVIWMGVTEGKEELIGLSRGLNRELAYIRKEEREPSPHITIGRVKSGRNRGELLRELEKLRHVNIGEVDVNEVKLKMSVLGKEGPEYSDLKVFDLE